MFGRKGRARPVAAPQEEESQRLPRVNEDTETWSVPGPRSPEEIDTFVGYTDIGSILLPAVRGIQMHIRVADDDASVLRALLVLDDSGLQISAAAAPRSDGVRDELRSQTLEGLRVDKAQVRGVRDRYGTEIYADIPVKFPDRRKTSSRMRIIGRKGDRWFSRIDTLRPTAQSPEAGAQIERILDRIVIVRDSKSRVRLDLPSTYMPNEQVEAPRA